MAQFNNLVVNGASRTLGKSYASTFVGPLEGLASSATTDKNGNDVTGYVKDVTESGDGITITKGDGSTESIPISGGSSTYAEHAGTADYATNASSTDYATNAGTATHASSADYSTNASSSTYAQKDASSQDIDETYIKDISISSNNLTFSNGKGASTGVTIEMASSATTATNAGTATYASTAGIASSATYDANGNNISENINDIELSNGIMTVTKANGSTEAITIDKASSATVANSASTATYDSEGNTITDYIKGIGINNGTMTLTKGDGSTTSQTIDKASSAAFASSAAKDESGNNINEYIGNISINNATMTLTKGDGSTSSITVDNVQSANSASSAVNASTATYDAKGNKIEEYINGISITNNTMTLTKGDSSTQDLTIAKASSATVADSASTASVDTLGNNLSTYVREVQKVQDDLVFTRGDGSTFSQPVGSSVANATSEIAGIMKLYTSTAGSNTDGTVNQNVIHTELETIQQAIANIVGFQLVIPDSGELPLEGEPGVIYLIPKEDSEEGNLYEEYVWVTITDPDTGEETSYFELIGVSNVDLSGYYTSSQVDTIVNNLLKNISISNGVATITKGDNTTFSVTIDKASSADIASSASYSEYANKDASSQVIDSTYLKSIAISNGTMTLTKGNGTTSDIIIDKASSATVADSATYAQKDASSQTINSTYIKGLAISNGTMTLTKGNGSTQDITIDKASSADTANLATHAQKDASSQTITSTYLKGLAISNGTMTLTKGNGSTSTVTIDKASSATVAEYATKDASSQTITSTYIKTLSISSNTLKVTKGNGSTQNITIAKASSATTATNAGTATYATNAGTATYANSASTAVATRINGASKTTNVFTGDTLMDFGYEG